MPKGGRCALCGETRSVTREHVPPKGLFLPPRPRNTITVPVCGPCNHGYHLDDEYFRTFVAALAEPETKLWRLWKEKVVASSFARAGGLRGRLNADHASLLRNHEQDRLRLPSDEEVPDEMLPRVQPFDASRVKSVVAKIVRCLDFHLGTPLAPSASIHVALADLSDSEIRVLHEAPTGQVGHDGESSFTERRPAIMSLVGSWRSMGNAASTSMSGPVDFSVQRTPRRCR
jgi:hypothetical protein